MESITMHFLFYFIVTNPIQTFPEYFSLSMGFASLALQFKLDTKEWNLLWGEGGPHVFKKSLVQIPDLGCRAIGLEVLEKQTGKVKSSIHWNMVICRNTCRLTVVRSLLVLDNWFIFLQFSFPKVYILCLGLTKIQLLQCFVSTNTGGDKIWRVFYEKKSSHERLRSQLEKQQGEAEASPSTVHTSCFSLSERQSYECVVVVPVPK